MNHIRYYIFKQSLISYSKIIVFHTKNINSLLFRIIHKVYFWPNYNKRSSFLVNILNDIALCIFFL